MWCRSSIEVQSDICLQCGLWYHWGWTRLHCHLKTVPLKNTNRSSFHQFYIGAGEDLHLDRLVVFWYNWKVLCLCCMIFWPSSVCTYEEWALSVSSQAECWLRMQNQWVRMWTVWDPLQWLHLLQSLFRSGFSLKSYVVEVKMVSADFIQHFNFNYLHPKLLHCCCVHKDSDHWTTAVLSSYDDHDICCFNWVFTMKCS